MVVSMCWHVPKSLIYRIAKVEQDAHILRAVDEPICRKKG